MTQESIRYFAIVPAAGSGSRMGGECPKQYLQLLGKPLLWHSLATLANVPRIEKVCVVLSPEDEWWSGHDWSSLDGRLIIERCGGATRAASVNNALNALPARAQDWVLVHDAARACLHRDQVEAMIDELGGDDVGGLLAAPVADTMKRSDPTGRVIETVSRDHLWQAQTPQMFRVGLLREALAKFPAVTDEAGAVEAMGLQPKLVASDARNFKVTYPGDLAQAEQILRARLEQTE